MKLPGLNPAAWIITGLVGLHGATVQASSDISVSEAWVREAPPGARVLAGYARISNNGTTDVVLEDVSSDSFDMSMLHKSRMGEGHQMMMLHMKNVNIPAGQSIQFKPGGMHIMLMRPRKELKAGDDVLIVMKFGSGQVKKARFPVVRK